MARSLQQLVRAQSVAAAKLRAKGEALINRAFEIRANEKKSRELYDRGMALVRRATRAGKHSEGPVGRLPNSLFGREAVARARQVKPIRRVGARRVQERDTKESGEIIGVQPGGFVKVKWDNRERPTLIKRSEIKRYPYLRNPTQQQRGSLVKGFKLGDRVIDNRGKRGYIFAWVIGKSGDDPKWCRIVFDDQKVGDRSLHDLKKENPGLMELAGSVQALEYLADKAGPERKRRRKRNATKSTRTSSDVKSPTRTSTSTKAKTTGNVTVTGGAGRGATTRVTIRKNPAVCGTCGKRAGAPYRQYDERGRVRYGCIDDFHTGHLVTPSESSHWHNRPEAKKHRASTKKHLASLGKRKHNPTVKQMSQTFQGSANGKTEEYYASDYAPRLDFSRGGKLVFLKLKGTSVRVPGAIVAIDPRTSKLWIAGSEKRAMFTRKAAKGELLDYGPVDAICYLTSKTHVGNGRAYEYVHNFGEEGGRKPKLFIDHDGMPILKGGDYKIEARGIVN